MDNCSFVKRVTTNVATAFFASLERCSCINLSTNDADDSAITAASADTVALNNHDELAGGPRGSSSRFTSSNNHNHAPTTTSLPVSSTV